jgi:hypothetical protein
LCSTNDDNVEARLLEAGVVLDGTTCACVIDDTDIHGVPYDDSFCSNQFDSTDPDRHDKAAARVEAICGWDL